MKTLMFARKALTELWRSRQIFWLFLLFPAMMVLIYYFAYSPSAGMANYITIAVIDNDEGPRGKALVQAMRAAEFDGKPAMTLIEGVSPRQAEILLSEGKAALLVTIPAGFSRALTPDAARPAQITLLGDPLSDTYAFAASFLREIIQTYTDEATGWTTELPARLEFLPNTGTMNDFQVGVPGLIVFGIMFGIISSALMLTQEVSSGTIQRIRLSNAGSGHFLGGVALAGIVLSLGQMLITYAVALLVGFQAVGSLWLAGLIGVICSLSAMGVGFIAACFSKSEGEATGYGTALMVPFVFFSGAVFPMPFVELFRIGNTPVQPYDLLPSTVAAQALRKIILYGEGLPGSAYELTLLTILSLALLAIGAGLYQKRILNR